jgi:hypothetical protein
MMVGYQGDKELDKDAPVIFEHHMAPITEKAPWIRYANREPRNKFEAWLWETWFDVTGKRLP